MFHPISNAELRLVPGHWSFAVERQTDIARHWQKAVADNPALWNGRVLMAREPRWDGDVLRAQMVETDFAAFLAWRDWEYPDRSVFNIFGSTLILSREGAVILGRMAADTASAGVYDMPGGALDLSDVRAGGEVDIFASAARELEEETGLTVAEGVHERDFAVIDGQLISVNRVMRFDFLAKELVATIKQRLATMRVAEFDDIIAIEHTRELQDLQVKSYSRHSVTRILDMPSG